MKDFFKKSLIVFMFTVLAVLIIGKGFFVDNSTTVVESNDWELLFDNLEEENYNIDFGDYKVIVFAEFVDRYAPLFYFLILDDMFLWEDFFVGWWNSGEFLYNRITKEFLIDGFNVNASYSIWGVSK